MNRSVKHDVNHVPLCAVLRRLGWPYREAAHYHGLGCDIITKHRDGSPRFIEFKRPGPPSCRKLTESEELLQRLLPEFYAVVQTEDELLTAVGLL